MSFLKTNKIPISDSYPMFWVGEHHNLVVELMDLNKEIDVCLTLVQTDILELHTFKILTMHFNL